MQSLYDHFLNSYDVNNISTIDYVTCYGYAVQLSG